MVLYSIIARLNKTGKSYGMEMNVEKMKVLKISTQPSAAQNMIDQKQPENVEYFNYLGSRIKLMQDVHVKFNPGLP